MATNELIGRWNITEMEIWNKEYFNMEIQAYIEIHEDYYGNFQFGLVEGNLDNGILCSNEMTFNFEGCDEMDPISGSLWIQLNDKNTIEGRFKFLQGDESTFCASRVVI